MNIKLLVFNLRLMTQHKILLKTSGCTLKTLFESFTTYANHFLRSRDYLNLLLIIKFLTFRRYLCILNLFTTHLGLLYRKEIKQEIAKKSLEEAVNRVLGIEVDEIPHVNFGDVWQLGPHTLTCCDSSTWDAPPAKLAFADPPYNAGIADWDIGFEWQHDWLIDKADLVVVMPCDESLAHFLRTTTMPYRCTIAHWIKNGMSKSPMGYGNHIIAAVFCKKSTPYKVTRKRNQNYSEGIIKNIETEDSDHPGRKPLDFMVTWIDRLTNPGEVVIDAFLGAGTTLIAAEQIGRICHGAEINPEYCGFVLGRWIKSGKENQKKIKSIVYA